MTQEEPGGSSPYGQPEEAAAAPGRPRRPFRFRGRRRQCQYCADKALVIDYKDVNSLRRFLSDRGRIEPRRKLGTCAKHQRTLAVALKRARHLALLPYSPEHIRASGFVTWRG